ncbi:MAG: T9SS type A sorting domain-containing protein [Bacteroidetes bacterium]|nr:T9SS type A sorting domain-containing protein [Bacteroidota bacterium]
MKKIILFLACNLLLLEAYAQDQHGCITDQYYQKQMQNNAEFKKNQDALEVFTQEFIKKASAAKSATASLYIIPIVFHVIHTGGSGNISDAQIIDQVQILNKEFPRQQADTVLTPAAFKTAAGAFNVEFRLATIDPNGNCTNGINRVYNSISNCSVNEDDPKSLSYWPSNKYLNVWLVQSMHYSGQSGCAGGGYATFPGGAATLDGINIRGDLISNIGTSASNSGWGNFKGRYLIHELGHWFNLRHIWGDANCGNDLVSDTPPHVNSNSGCPNFPRNPNNSCGGGPNGEMYTDYMDYTNGSCLNMFTAGQVVRMTACINGAASGRNNLWSNGNLIATGTADPYIYPVVCTAVPDILPFGTIVACVGDSVKFTDYSYGGNSSSRSWNFFGSPSSSLTDSIVKVKYNFPGVYNIALTKTYLSSSKTTTFTNKVYVLDSATSSHTIPYSESFENAATFVNEWTAVNKNNDVADWQNVSTTNYTGNNCVSIANHNSIAPSTDELISPAFDLSATASNTLSFRLHFATRATTNSDKLDVSISNNCGLTWFSVYSKSGSALKTVTGNINGSNVPAPASPEWREEKINIDDTHLSAKTRFRFSFTAGGGNNIFIDDININGISTVGIKENSAIASINLFPNPANAILNLNYTLKNKAAVKLEMTDILGKIQAIQTTETVNEGENKNTINTSSLKQGIYFISIKQNGAVIYSSKFIKQGS